MDPAVFGDRWSTLRSGDPPLYPPRRGPIADATAHERRLRGDGFGDGFGADLSPLGRSTGGDSAPVLPSFARSAGGAPGSLRLRVGGSSPSSGASQPADAQFSPSGAGDSLVVRKRQTFKTAEAPVGIEPTNRGFAGRGALTCNLSSVHSNALGPSCREPRLTEDGSRGRYGRVVGLAL